MKNLILLSGILALVLAGCNDPKKKPGNNIFNNQNPEVCDNLIDDDGDTAIDCDDLDCLGVGSCSAQNNNNVNNNNNNTQHLFTLRGKVWGPGADNAAMLDANRIPVPQALVAAYSYEPPDPTPLPGGLCNKCVDVPSGVIHQFSDTDGSFELFLYPNIHYWLVVQKGEFRRVTEITAGGPDGVEDLELAAGQPRNPATTLPNRFNPNLKQWIPKILVIEGSYEQMDLLFEAMGFDYGVEVVVMDDTAASGVFNDMNQLRQYNLIITTCGDDASYLTTANARANLRQYVYEGGKLYVDDFSYDFAEQPFPEFLNFQVNQSSSFSTGTCGLGTSSPSSIGQCNNWSSYNPSGTPGDPYLDAWLGIVNPGGTIELLAAWDIIHSMNPGLQGECEDDLDPNCVDGNYIGPPKVWMYGDWSGYTHNPVTVSWNYYCGKVLYTVYHTHSGSSSSTGWNYPLILQEKIMMYLIMEIQTCTDPVIVE